MVRSDPTTSRAGGRGGRPWRAAGAAVVVLLAMVGAGMLGASVRTVPAPRPPQPPAQADPDQAGLESADQAALGAADPDPGPAGLSRSAPTTIAIPRIGVDADIMSLGTNPDGTVQVPPLDQAQRAGWYSPGPSPGEVGSAVVVGHVDSAELGPAVFFNLSLLRPGDTITVTRADRSTATFTVEAVRSYPKTSFPTELVYGPGHRPSLRLVTCGGTFDQGAGSYLDNVVAFAAMTA